MKRLFALLALSPVLAHAEPIIAQKQPLNLHAIGMFFVFVLATLLITDLGRIARSKDIPQAVVLQARKMVIIARDRGQ